MAVLSTNQLEEIRRACAQDAPASPNYTKAQINLALQAIEDYFENTARAGISAAIDAAVSPFSFTANQKKRLAKYWLLQKAGRE